MFQILNININKRKKKKSLVLILEYKTMRYVNYIIIEIIFFYLGNYLLFKNELISIETLTLSQSEQLIDILQYLYDSKILHRDLRPANLMFDN